MRRLLIRQNCVQVPLNVVLALSFCLVLPGCSVLNAEGERRNKLWESYSAQGVSAERKQNWTSAKGLYKQALDVSEKFGKADLRRTMTMIDYASMLHKSGDDAKAQPLFEEALASYDKWRTNKATDEELNRVGKRLAICYQGLAQIYVSQGKPDAGEQAYVKALAFTKADYFPKRFISELHNEYAGLLRSNGKKQQADALLMPIEAVSDGLEATISRTELVDLDWHKIRDDAGLLEREGQNQKAAALRKAGIETCTKKYGANDSRTLQMLSEYTLGLRFMKQDAEAEKVLVAAIKGHEGAADQPFLAQLHNQLAQIYFDQKRYPAAIKSAEEGSRIGKILTEGAIQADGDWLVGRSLYLTPGRKDEGLRRLKQAVRVRGTETYDISYYGMVLNLSDMFIAENQLDEAAQCLEKAGKAQEKMRPTAIYALTMRKLSKVYGLQGKRAQAIETAAAADRLAAGAAVPVPR